MVEGKCCRVFWGTSLSMSTLVLCCFRGRGYTVSQYLFPPFTPVHGRTEVQE